MTTPVYKLEKDLCRCCHAEGSFFNLEKPVYNNLGHKEVFSDMLRTSLNIELLPMPGDINKMTFTICAACVFKLREAHNFKRQVELCEQQFNAMYKNIVVPSVITVEIKEDSDAFEYDVKSEMEVEDDGFDMKLEDFSVEEDQSVIVIKAEEPAQSKSKAKPKSAVTKCKTNETSFKKTSMKSVADGTKDENMKSDGDADKNPRTADDDQSATVIEPEGPARSKSKAKQKSTVTRCKTKKKTSKKPVADETNDENTKSDGDADKNPKTGNQTRPKYYARGIDYRSEGDVFVCTLCEKRYKVMRSIVSHIKTKHYKIWIYSCQHCEKRFEALAGLIVHKLEEHNIDERYKCNACEAVFSRKSRLNMHIKSFHMLGEKYKCEFCEYECYGTEPLQRHSEKHKTEKNHHCKFCKKSFLRKRTMILHEKIHTGDKRKTCKVCDQAFVQKASLNYHMTKYHPEVYF